MASVTAVEVRLRLAPDGDTVTGSLVEPNGTTTDFEGYVELIAAIERLLGRHRPSLDQEIR
jgi:hypothetical protein